MDAEHTAPYPAGQLHGQCTLFIRGPIYDAMVAGRHQFIFMLKGRRGRTEKNVKGIWGGPAAEAWVRANRTEAKPGRNLHITFSDAACHVVDYRAELHIYIESAELVPMTPGHEATDPPYQSEAHA